MRVKRATLESLLAILAEACGRRVAESWKDVGGWALDNNPTYGGYVVIEYLEHGAIRHPLTDYRVAPRDMEQILRFAIRACAETRRQLALSGALQEVDED